jgi:hypothetical protein
MELGINLSWERKKFLKGLMKERRGNGVKEERRESNSQFQKPRERKIIENEIFLGPIYLNTPFSSNYYNALALHVFIRH